MDKRTKIVAGITCALLALFWLAALVGLFYGFELYWMGQIVACMQLVYLCATCSWFLLWPEKKNKNVEIAETFS